MCSPDGEQAGAAPGPEDKTAAQPLTGESASPGPQKEESRLLSPSYFEMIPVQYRKGPWSPVSYVTLGGWMVVLLSMIPRMAQSYAQDVARIAPTPGDRSWWLTVAIATWCLALSAVMVRQWTIWPFFSYTLMCWSLLMLRCACAALGHYSHVALVAAEVLRFPALAGMSPSRCWCGFRFGLWRNSMRHQTQRGHTVRCACAVRKVGYLGPVFPDGQGDRSNCCVPIHRTAPILTQSKNSDSEFHPENAAVQSKSAVFALSM